MQIKYGSIVTAGSGNLGGSTFSHCRAGDYIKSSTRKLSTQTSYGREGIVRRSIAVKRWRSSSGNTRRAWNAYAHQLVKIDSLGMSRIPSGFQAYVKHLCNILIVNSSGTLTTPKATYPRIYTITSVSVNLGSSSISVTFTTSGSGDSGRTFLMTRAVPPGVVLKKSDFRIVSAANNVPSSPNNFYGRYTNRFGVYFPSGYQIGLAIQGISALSGLRTDPTYYYFTIP